MAKKRPEFIRMIKKCRQGKIDLILTKSISRFSRNTVDCLEYIRELKQLRIGVIFEKENINTLTQTSEALITIMGYFAQAESESISKNVTWGVRHSFEQGKVFINCKYLLGYKNNGKCNIEIVPEEAKTVKRIFNQFVTGDSTRQIKISLEQDGIRSPMGSEKWSPQIIMNILRNEKYKGDVITQKTYVVDLLNHKRAKNNGQLAQHYLTDHHPAIIDRELFDRVQAELARRSGNRKNVSGTDTFGVKSKYSGKYALTGMLICGYCGSPYRRCTWRKADKNKIVWRCSNRLEYGTKVCPDSTSIEENRLHQAIIKSLNSLVDNKEEMMIVLKSTLSTVIADADTDISLVALRQQIKEQEQMMMQMVTLSIESGKGPEAFEVEFKKIFDRIEGLKKILQVESTKQKTQNTVDARLEKLMDIIETANLSVSSFNNNIIRQLISEIKVVDGDRLVIMLKGGFRVKVNIK